MTSKKIPSLLKPGPMKAADRQALESRMAEMGKKPPRLTQPKGKVQKKGNSRGR